MMTSSSTDQFSFLRIVKSMTFMYQINSERSILPTSENGQNTDESFKRITFVVKNYLIIFNHVTQNYCLVVIIN